MQKKIVKSTGKLEEFDRNKLIKSIVDAGAPEEIAIEIAKEVESKLQEGMTTSEIRRYVLARLKELAPQAYEAWTFYDRIAKGRITFEDGKYVVVEKGHLYLGREVKDVGPKGLSSSEEVEGILHELEEDLKYGISKATINARLYALLMGVLKSKHMPKEEKEKSVQMINSFRQKLGWKPYELKKPVV
ncbi:MAG: ATP-binding protein [Thermofilum sp.]|jgi:hypothetical protein|uniref:ATP cone domain-containing protein n=1 Tax=Thermofilum sp. TaxID=1961369 RepID=UPI00258ABD8F|nr:ATP cone domain-containing protein [Thermofilum sp.]MCI4408674.1 ATP-binding protein [Thermofilum sp.]